MKLLFSSKSGRLAVRGLLSMAAMGLVITGIVTQLDWSNPVEAARVDRVASPVDPWVYGRLQAIRRELMLTNTDLASMGLGKDASKALLLSLKHWVEQNREQLDAKDRVVLKARRDLELAHRSIRVGPRDEEVIRSLPSLEDALSRATTSLQAFHERAGKAIEGRLSKDQYIGWQMAKANSAAGVPSRYRFAAGLSEMQRERIKDALSKRVRDGELSVHDQADRELSSGQRQAIEAARANQAANLDAVAEAEEEALPRLRGGPQISDSRLRWAGPQI